MADKRVIGGAVVAAAVIAAASAAAADGPAGRIVSIDGTAMVSEGGRYVTGSEGRAIQLGDRILVLEGGRAAIWYGDTCEYFLLDDEVLDVTEASPCASGLGGHLRPEIADPSASTDGAYFRLAQMGAEAPPADDGGGAVISADEAALESGVEAEGVVAAETTTAPGAGAAGGSTGTIGGLAGSVTIAGTTMTTGTLIGITSMLALGALAATEGEGGGGQRQEDPISEIR
jgi:hypothetical protein